MTTHSWLRQHAAAMMCTVDCKVWIQEELILKTRRSEKAQGTARTKLPQGCPWNMVVTQNAPLASLIANGHAAKVLWNKSNNTQQAIGPRKRPSRLQRILTTCSPPTAAQSRAAAPPHCRALLPRPIVARSAAESFGVDGPPPPPPTLPSLILCPSTQYSVSSGGVRVLIPTI